MPPPHYVRHKIIFAFRGFQVATTKITAPVAVLRSIHRKTDEVEIQLPTVAIVATWTVRVGHFLLYALQCSRT